MEDLIEELIRATLVAISAAGHSKSPVSSTVSLINDPKTKLSKLNENLYKEISSSINSPDHRLANLKFKSLNLLGILEEITDHSLLSSLFRKGYYNDIISLPVGRLYDNCIEQLKSINDIDHMYF